VLAAVDVFPTLASIAGAPLPEGYRGDGEDVSAALLGTPHVRTTALFWEYGRNEDAFTYPKAPDRSPTLALREGPWKLLMNPDGSNMELYDLAADLKESQNVVAAHDAVATKMKEALLNWKRGLPK
jgi:arylsulfatase A-like enzyme